MDRLVETWLSQDRDEETRKEIETLWREKNLGELEARLSKRESPTQIQSFLFRKTFVGKRGLACLSVCKPVKNSATVLNGRKQKTTRFLLAFIEIMQERDQVPNLSNPSNQGWHLAPLGFVHPWVPAFLVSTA